MQIPHEALAEETLRNLLEEFVTREGTDYGSFQYSLADKVAKVMQQLTDGRAVILYDPEHMTCHIEMKDRLPVNQE